MSDIHNIVKKLLIYERELTKFRRLKKILPRVVKSNKILKNRVIEQEMKILRLETKIDTLNDIINNLTEECMFLRNEIGSDLITSAIATRNLRRRIKALQQENNDLKLAVNLNMISAIEQLDVKDRYIIHPNLQIKIEMGKVRNFLNNILSKC